MLQSLSTPKKPTSDVSVSGSSGPDSAGAAAAAGAPLPNPKDIFSECESVYKANASFAYNKNAFGYIGSEKIRSGGEKERRWGV